MFIVNKRFCFFDILVDENATRQLSFHVSLTKLSSLGWIYFSEETRDTKCRDIYFV